MDFIFLAVTSFFLGAWDIFITTVSISLLHVNMEKLKGVPAT